MGGEVKVKHEGGHHFLEGSEATGVAGLVEFLQNVAKLWLQLQKLLERAKHQTK